jgi:UDP-sugar transporter A1/2/3
VKKRGGSPAPELFTLAATKRTVEVEMPSKSPPREAVPKVFGIPLKYAALVLLCVQNSGAVLVMRKCPPHPSVATPCSFFFASCPDLLLSHTNPSPQPTSPTSSHLSAAGYTRSMPGQNQYLTSTAVIMGEVFKVVVSAFLAFVMGNEKPSAVWANPLEVAKTGVPAFLYLVQNNLQYVAVSNLHAATYQVTYQLKILSTAIMSVLLLKKEISQTKWLALGLLTAGVACVQISSIPAGKLQQENANLNLPVGLASTIAACCCSGLAGVYFELILKKSEVGLWVRNIQLGLYSIVIGYAGYCFEINSLGDRAPEHGFFHGYTSITLFNIVVQSCGGLIIAVVIKFADNILKNFSTAISIIVSSVISWMFMGFNLTFLFAIGVALVNYAVYLYGKKAPEAIGE